MDQIAIFARSHACIVLTRCSFIERMAMTAIEAIFTGGPLVTNLQLASDESLHKRKRAAFDALNYRVYNRDHGLVEVLMRTLSPDLSDTAYSGPRARRNGLGSQVPKPDDL